jgi:hypothetical protein
MTADLLGKIRSARAKAKAGFGVTLGSSRGNSVSGLFWFFGFGFLTFLCYNVFLVSEGTAKLNRWRL